MAITANSEIYTKRELEAAKSFAVEIGAKHVVIEVLELEIAGFADNPTVSCFYC